MAVRPEELALTPPAGARIYRFPQERVARSRKTARAAARRRRTLGTVAVVLATAALLASGTGAPAAAPPREVPRSVVIAPGDTLWDLARRYAPAGSDPRAYVDALTALNELDSGVVTGQRILLRK